MKSIFNLFIALVSVLFVISCKNEPEETTVEVRRGFEHFKDSVYTNYKADVLKKNEVLLYTLYDSVAYKSLDLVLRDRVYPTNLERIPDLKKVPLNNMSGKLIDKGENIDSVKTYIRRFINLREKSLKDGLSSNVAFSKTTNDIIISDVFKKNIVKEKDTVLEYRNLSEQIKRKIKSAQIKYKKTLIKSIWLEKEGESLEDSFKSYEENTKESAADSNSKWMNNNWLLSGLLTISLLINLILGLLLFRNKRNIGKEEIQENKTLESKHKSELPSSLTQPEVYHYISKAFTKLQADLKAKYHKDCIETQIEKLNACKADVSEKSKSQQFNDLAELEQFVSPFMNKYQNQIVQKLAELLDKYSALQQFEQKSNTENYALKYESSIIT
ncbi:MAG: hypothetical protein WBB27_07070, partial [Maribacter sp.]